MNSFSPTPSPPPSTHWTVQDCQAWDRCLQGLGLPAASLMEQAAKSISDFLLGALDQGLSGTVSFLCGPGNNGADGVAAARQLLGHPLWAPQVFLTQGPPTPGSLLALQVDAFQGLGGELRYPSSDGRLGLPENPLVWVDALFGIGLTRPLTGFLAELLHDVAQGDRPVLAVDCPSGLDCDSGEIRDTAIPADWTMSFAAPKQGFSLAAGPALVGKVIVADLGVRAEIAQAWKRNGRRFQAC